MNQELDNELDTKAAASVEDLTDNRLVNDNENSEVVFEEISEDDERQLGQEVLNFLQMIEQKVHLQLMKEQLTLDNAENSTANDCDEDYVNHRTDEDDSDEDATPRGSQLDLIEAELEPAVDSDAIFKHIKRELKRVVDQLEDNQLQLEIEAMADQQQEFEWKQAEQLLEDKQTELEQLESALKFVAKSQNEAVSISDVELKQYDLPDSEESVASCHSYKSQQSNSLKIESINESFSLKNVINTSGVINANWPEDQESHYKQKFLSLLVSNESFDIEVYIGPAKFYCQLAILQLYSSHFSPNPKQAPYKMRLPADQVTPEAFKSIYHWMRHDNPTQLNENNKRSLIEFYKAAKFLVIPELIESVCTVLEKITHEGEAFSLLQDFNQLKLLDFETLFLSRISRFFLTLVASREFVEMSSSFVSQLLNSNFLGVNSEIEVFYAAVRWLSHNWPQRQSHVQNVISHVRFGLLSPIFLRFLQLPQTTRVMNCISSCSLVKELINKAFVKFAASELYAQDPGDYQMLQLREHIVSEPRKWLFDPKCPYHQSLATCNMRQLFSYEQFLEYLELLQHSKPDEWQQLQYLSETISCCPH